MYVCCGLIESKTIPGYEDRKGKGLQLGWWGLKMCVTSICDRICENRPNRRRT